MKVIDLNANKNKRINSDETRLRATAYENRSEYQHHRYDWSRGLADCYLISFLLIRMMDNTKKSIAAKSIQTTLNPANTSGLRPRKDSILPNTSPLVKPTKCVSGNTARAVVCSILGKTVNGKNVPLSKNMGVINKNEGKLKKSMFAANAVKHMPRDANNSPPKNASTGTKTAKGEDTNPKAATIASTIVPLIVARVAPHKSSPAITSSKLMGVAIKASKVFW